MRSNVLFCFLNFVDYVALKPLYVFTQKGHKRPSSFYNWGVFTHQGKIHKGYESKPKLQQITKHDLAHQIKPVLTMFLASILKRPLKAIKTL